MHRDVTIYTDRDGNVYHVSVEGYERNTDAAIKYLNDAVDHLERHKDKPARTRKHATS